MNMNRAVFIIDMNKKRDNNFSLYLCIFLLMRGFRDLVQTNKDEGNNMKSFHKIPTTSEF